MSVMVVTYILGDKSKTNYFNNKLFTVYLVIHAEEKGI